MSSNRPSGKAPRVANYFRKSRSPQEKSILRQHAELDPYSVKQGWNVVAEIEDEDISGSEVLKRPGLQQLLRMVTNGDLDGIGLDDFDRLLRLDLIDMGRVVGPIRDASVFIESAAQGRFPYDTLQGRLTIGVTAEAKHMELVSISRKALAETLRLSRDTGIPPLQHPPYGYRRVEDMDKPLNKRGVRPGKFVIVEREAEVVRAIFKWIAEGYTPNWICEELARRSVLSPRGLLRWTRPQIAKMIQRPVYLGDRVYGATGQGKYHRIENKELIVVKGFPKKEYKPQEEWMIATGTHPLIISRELWEDVQKVLARNRRREVKDEEGNVLRIEGRSSTPKREPGAYVLAKLLVCGQCHCFMTGYKNQAEHERPTYSCSQYQAHGRNWCIRCEVDEEEAVKALVTRLRELLSPEWQGMLRKKLRESLAKGKADTQRKDLQKKVNALEAKAGRLRERVGEVDKDMIQEMQQLFRECKDELDKAKEQLRILVSCNPTRDLEEAIDASAKLVWTLEEAIHGKNRLALQAALKGIVASVTVLSKEYKTPNGKLLRHKPCGYEVEILRGIGLDLICGPGGLPEGKYPSLHVDLPVSA